MKVFCNAIFLLCCLASKLANADILSSSPTHFELRHEAGSTLTPDALWSRLIKPATWWHPDHTYSGDAGNLMLDAQAGGLWREDWEGGSIAHGQVLLVETGKRLRLSAPFGPLQELGVYSVWTITITADGDGSMVVFSETATGPPGANLEEMAKAVDFVKTEAITRLTGGAS